MIVLAACSAMAVVLVMEVIVTMSMAMAMTHYDARIGFLFTVGVRIEADALEPEFESVPEVSGLSKPPVEADAMRSVLMTKRSCAYDIPNCSIEHFAAAILCKPVTHGCCVRVLTSIPYHALHFCGGSARCDVGQG